MSRDTLPDSRPRVQKNSRWIKGVEHVPIYCASCGIEGGWVPAKNMTFAFWLCEINGCAEKWSPLVGTYCVPDEVFWQKVREEQMAQYGRDLSAQELIEVLKDDSNSLTKLCKERPDFNTIKMT